MKRIIYSLFPAVFLLLLFTRSGSGPAEILAFDDVTVIPMDRNRKLEHQVVLVSNGRILKVADKSATKIPAGAKVIDGRNRFLVPGFFDMHTHFFYEQGNNRNTCEAELKLMLANGLTTVRIQCGDPVYLEAREKVRTSKWAGPRLFVSSPQFVGGWPWKGKVFARICETPQAAVDAVRECKKSGYDEIKITFMVKRDVYDAIIKTAREENIRVTGHVGPLVKLPAALLARQQIEHMDEFIDMLLPDTSYNHGQSVSDMNIWRKKAWATVPFLDERRIPALVKEVRKAGVYVTPTNYFFFSSFADSVSEDQYMARTDFSYIPPAIKEERWKVREHYWKNAPPPASREKYKALRKKMTYELARSGVKLMAGSDSPEWFLVQGFSIHDELRVFVDAGLSPYEALETATRNPASYLSIIKQKGTIEEGKDADLILLDRNPLDDISNTRSVSGVCNGKHWYDKAALDEMLRQARAELSI